MSTTELQHYGVKGMKWGVRNAALKTMDKSGFTKLAKKNYERSLTDGRAAAGLKVGKKLNDSNWAKKRAAKKIAKLDKKWEKQFSGMNGFIKMNNAVADHMNGPNGELGKLNSKPKYKDVNFNDPKNKKLYDSYMKDVADATHSAYKSAAKDFGSNASGTVKMSVTRHGDNVQFFLEELSHADEQPLFSGHVDAQGLISDIDYLEAEEEDPFIAQAEAAADFLAHYGVKGMKWGQRKSKSGIVKEAHSEDAEKLGGIQTRAKTQKSTKMLSNKELQDAIKRMQLEQQFSQLSGNIDKTTAQKASMFVKNMVQTSGKQSSQQLANEKAKSKLSDAFEFAVKKGAGIK